MTDEERFEAITSISIEVNNWARSQGFYDKERNTGEVLALIHSEVSEALEAYRDGDDFGFAEELADIVIRVMDTSAAHDIDLGAQIKRKMAINRQRERLHGRAGDIQRMGPAHGG